MAGKCSASCGGTHSCHGDATCTADGRCVDHDNGIDPGFGGEGGGNGDCVDVTVEFDKEIPNVVLLVDQSGSMCASLSGQSRWDAVKNVLIGETGTDGDRGIVGELESEVRFGLTTYAARIRNNSSCSNGNAQGSATGDLVITPIDVSLALDNFEAIDGEFRGLGVGSGTPTGQAYELAAASLLADTNPGSKIIVLATDGEPGLYAPNGSVATTSNCPEASCDEDQHRGCCPGGECTPSHCTNCTVGSSCPRNRVVHAVASAHPDIRTFVISVGTGEVAIEHLQEVANVGQGLPGDTTGPDAATYYTADSSEELVNAFRSIIDGVRSCVFSLGGEVQVSEAHRGTVRLNGEALEMGNEQNGWRLNNQSELELLGQACDDIKSGDPHLEIRFPCGTVVVR